MKAAPTLILAIVLTAGGCSIEEPPPEAVPVEHLALYEMIHTYSLDHERALERIVAGDEVAGRNLLVAATDRLAVAAEVCARTAGCDTTLFAEATRQVLLARSAAIETAADSPLIDAVPELGRTVAVEAIARAERARMARARGHRTDRRTLRRLSTSGAYLDLAGRGGVPFEFGKLGVAESRFIGERFDGDRRIAQRRCASRVARLLGAKNEGRALRALAPLLCMIEDLPDWSRRDRSALARAISAKDAPSETDAARRFKAHPRLGAALRAIADRVD